MIHSTNSSEDPVGGRNGSKASRSGFTLMELLVVISIIAVLAGLLLPVLGAARRRAKRLHAESDVDQLVDAWLAYRLDYRRFPDPKITMMNSNAIAILRGAGPQNPNGYNYMDFRSTTKYFCDPWSKDGSTEEGVYRVELGTMDNVAVAVWSVGPDRANDTDDDIRSWRED